MAKKKPVKKSAKKKVRTHVFTGGNYAVGSDVVGNTGCLKFVQLKKPMEFGAQVKDKDTCGTADVLYFMDRRTVLVMIEHFTNMAEHMNDDVQEVVVTFDKS